MAKTKRQRRMTRREFVGGAVAAAGVAAGFPTLLRGRNLNDKLNIAIIGAGGRGVTDTTGVASENIVVLCDVNSVALDAQGAKYPKAAKIADFRKVFDRPNDFDAVVVATPESTHAFATLLALKHGKHVYCEKPLTHNIGEARLIRETASKLKLATQMGNQGHASDNHRRVKELIQAGVVGPIREVHVWVDRAWGLQSQEAATRNKDILYVADMPAPEPVPANWNWDLWIGPAPERPFSSVYVPGPKWYRWWDFGNGTMSDLGSHRNDLAFYALELGAPLTIEPLGVTGPGHPLLAPASMMVKYEYGARGPMPPVTLTWYQGEVKPPMFKDLPAGWPDAKLFVGDKGMILTTDSKHLLLPEKNFAGFAAPPQTIPNSPGHYVEWIEACKGGKPSLANFEYAGRTTEANHLGNVAHRVGRKLVWDPAKMKATNAPEADKFIRREYRKGWEGYLKA